MCREVLQIANHINATTSNTASDYDTISPTQPLSGEPGQAPSSLTPISAAVLTGIAGQGLLDRRSGSIKRDLHRQRRGAPDEAADSQLPAKRLHAVNQPDESGPIVCVSAPNTVIGIARCKFAPTASTLTFTSDACACFAAFVSDSATTQ